MESEKNNNPPKSSKRKLILIGAAGLGALAIGGLGYWYFRGRKKKAQPGEKDLLKELSLQENSTQEFHSESSPKPKKTAHLTSQSVPKVTPPVSNKNFPLKRGSKGSEVKQIQEALINAYGKSILPNSGADGVYGSGLEKALTAKGFPLVIDEATFKKITEPANPVPNTPALPNSGLSASAKENVDIAKNIWLNVTLKKLDPLLEQFKRIKSVDHYSKVNDLFKTIRIQGVRQTIVNAALTAFYDATSKQFISEALKAIGLKYHDEKWNLSGPHHKSHKHVFTF